MRKRKRLLSRRYYAFPWPGSWGVFYLRQYDCNRQGRKK